MSNSLKSVTVDRTEHPLLHVGQSASTNVRSARATRAATMIGPATSMPLGVSAEDHLGSIYSTSEAA